METCIANQRHGNNNSDGRKTEEINCIYVRKHKKKPNGKHGYETQCLFGIGFQSKRSHCFQNMFVIYKHKLLKNKNGGGTKIGMQRWQDDKEKRSRIRK